MGATTNGSTRAPLDVSFSSTWMTPRVVVMELRFVPSESTFSYFDATREYITKYGKPAAFYSDKAGIFRANAKAPRCGPNATQFTRAMGELNIDILCA